MKHPGETAGFLKSKAENNGESICRCIGLIVTFIEDPYQVDRPNVPSKGVLHLTMAHAVDGCGTHFAPPVRETLECFDSCKQKHQQWVNGSQLCFESPKYGLDFCFFVSTGTALVKKGKPNQHSTPPTSATNIPSFLKRALAHFLSSWPKHVSKPFCFCHWSKPKKQTVHGTQEVFVVATRVLERNPTGSPF